MTRTQALSTAREYVDRGGFREDLARRIAYRTESQDLEGLPKLHQYLRAEMQPAFEAMGYTCEILANPYPKGGPVLLATRIEDSSLPTILGYGHADVVRGDPETWTKPLSPWRLHVSGDMLYGRGTADNKGQHTLQLAALGAVLQTRGNLGFNSKFILESSEEVGSVGLFRILKEHHGKCSADIFIASDGPRIDPRKPIIALGGRGVINFDLIVEGSSATGCHPGHWGGIAGNPALILAHALTILADRNGGLLVPAWRAGGGTKDMREALRLIERQGASSDQEMKLERWGEPELSWSERLYRCNSFEVLSLNSGHHGTPVNAIPKKAWASCQLRYVPEFEGEALLDSLQSYLNRRGLREVKVVSRLEPNQSARWAARGDPKNPFVQAVASLLREAADEVEVPILPNSSGSNASGSFQRALGVETVWIPLAYRGSNQHAPDEHILLSECREGVRELVWIYWGIGARLQEKVGSS